MISLRSNLLMVVTGNHRQLGIATILMGAAIVGTAQTFMPFLGPLLLIGGVLLPALLVIDAWIIVVLIVALPMYSRLLVALGAPAVLNYAHFALVPLIAGRLLSYLHQRDSESRGRRAITVFVALAVLMAISIVMSASLMGWQAQRPILLYLTLTEPFFVLALMLTLSREQTIKVRAALIGMAASQIPFVVFQATRYGFADYIKGTLLEQGAGHHVLGGFCVVASILSLLSAEGRGRRIWLYVLAAVLFLIGIAADAKQVYGALLAAGLILSPKLFGNHWRKFIPVTVVLGAVFWLGLAFWPPLQTVLDHRLVEQYLRDKITYASIVTDRFGLAEQLLGAGPGLGTSRIALLTIPGYGNVPEAIVGSEPATISRDLIQSYRSKWSVNPGSSANSPFQSWLGIFSDIGLLGLATYLLLAIWAWRTLRDCDPTGRAVGQMLLVFAGILGLIYTWLEEPIFVMYLAAAIGTFRHSAPERSTPNVSARPLHAPRTIASVQS